MLGLPVLEPLLVGLDPDLGEVLRGLKQKVHPFHPLEVLPALMLEPPFLGVRHPMEVVRLDEVPGVLLEQYRGRLYPYLVKGAYLQFRKEVCVRKTRTIMV